QHRNTDKIKKIECLGCKQPVIFDPRDFHDTLYVVVFCTKEILEITYKKPVECIQRIQQKHVNMLIPMLVQVLAIGKYPHQIALLDIRIPMLDIRIGMVECSVPLGPQPTVATEKLQHIHKPLVVLPRLEYRSVSGIMERIDEQHNHGKPQENIAQKPQR